MIVLTGVHPDTRTNILVVSRNRKMDAILRRKDNYESAGMICHIFKRYPYKRDYLYAISRVLYKLCKTPTPEWKTRDTLNHLLKCWEKYEKAGYDVVYLTQTETPAPVNTQLRSQIASFLRTLG